MHRLASWTSLHVKETVVPWSFHVVKDRTSRSCPMKQTHRERRVSRELE